MSQSQQHATTCKPKRVMRLLCRNRTNRARTVRGGDTRQNTECNHILIRMVRKVFSDLLGRGLSTWKEIWCPLQLTLGQMLHIAVKIAISLEFRLFQACILLKQEIIVNKKWELHVFLNRGKKKWVKVNNLRILMTKFAFICTTGVNDCRLNQIKIGSETISISIKEIYFYNYIVFQLILFYDLQRWSEAV